MNRLPVYRAPWWLPGGHLQTIFPVARKAPLPAYRRERWDTPDGDFIELDWVDPAGPASAAPMRIAPPQPAVPQADPAPLSVPLFIVLFLLASMTASALPFPALFRFLASAGKVFMAAALCLVGLGLHRSVVNRAGVRGMLFGAALWAVSIVTGYVLATIG